MQETTNYKFKKPDGTDNIDINVFNDNIDKIDEFLYKLSIPYVVATGTENNYIAKLDSSISMYTEGMGVCLKINATNTGTSTLNINDLGAVSILDKDGNIVSSGSLKANIPYTMRYNGSAFILQ